MVPHNVLKLRLGKEGGEQEGENRRTREERAKERGHKGGKERKGEEEVHCTERAHSAAPEPIKGYTALLAQSSKWASL